MKKLLAIFLAVLLMATPVLGEDFVQIRRMAEAHGWIVDWSGEHGLVLFTTPSGEGFFINVAESGSFIENGRTYVPADMAVEIFEFYAAMMLEARLAEDTNIHGMLTRIEYGENTAYIFGSMHASRPHWFPLADIAEEAMERSDVFVFEVDMTEFSNMSDELEARIEEIQMLPDGLTLEDILPRDVFENFYANLETFAAIGLTYEIVQGVTPVTLMATLESIMLSLLGLDLVASVDSYIAGFAEMNNRPIIGLNCIISEFEIVFDVPLEIQAYALADFPDFETMLAGFDEMGKIALYETQNFDGIRELLSAMAYHADNPHAELMRHNLMYVRDNIFAAEIARLLRETEEPTTFFITMGIAHILRGYGYVFDFLEEKGFEFTPLWDL
jgi:uncharacterized protein YbaP (TraB family)